MDFGVESKLNPWIADNASVALNTALLLAEKTGHIYRRGDHVDDSVSQQVDQMPSIKMINLQKELSQHGIEIDKINFEIQKRMLYQETKDLVDIGIIEQRINKVKELVVHLQSVMNCKEDLVNHLQKPFSGEYLKLGAHYHGHACEVFAMVAPLLSDLTTYFEDLSWVNGSALLSNQLDEVLTDISTTLATLQTGFQTITHMSHCISGLQSGTIHHTSFKDAH